VKTITAPLARAAPSHLERRPVMAKKKEVYGYVLYIERTKLDERLVFIHRTMTEAEEELRDYVATIWAGGIRDDELLDALTEEDERVVIFECSNLGSIELTPFARRFKAA
jgi:hypothetical protein